MTHDNRYINLFKQTFVIDLVCKLNSKPCSVLNQTMSSDAQNLLFFMSLTELLIESLIELLIESIVLLRMH